MATGGNAAHAVNPFRYRGYYYDTETGLYYLQSRYYNPEWGRFLNADRYVSTGTGLLGYNMYAYCCNNPVMLRDKTGENFLIDLYERLIEKDVKTQKKYAKAIEKVSNVIRDVQCQMSFFVQTVEEAVYYEAVGGCGFGISASIENAEATALARYATGIKKSVGDKISDTSVVVIDEIKFDFAAFFCHMITGAI